MPGIPPHPPIDAATYTLDDKSRVAVPAIFRFHYVPGGLGAFVLTVAPDGCLALFPVDEWRDVQSRMTPENLGIDQFQFARFARFVSSNTTLVNTDPQGRIRVPQSLQQYANLTKEVYILSMDNRLELWNYADYQKSQGSMADLMPHLNTLHFMPKNRQPVTGVRTVGVTNGDPSDRAGQD